jgi:lipoprotein-releasing system ATP-binding protein
MCILKADNISKTYYKTGEEISVLNCLSLFIKHGEILVLMGPSGSGKSTLLNILGTLDTDFTGSLVIDNVLISDNIDLSFIRSNKLGFVFQFHHLLPEFTIYENLLIPGMISGNNDDRRQEIVEMLKLLGLQERKNHYPNEVSGGERQRIAVMRALVNRPSIVLADEPTGNLDSENSQLLLKLLVSLRAKYKQSFIIATHDHTILDIADRVLYLKDGKIKKEI